MHINYSQMFTLDICGFVDVIDGMRCLCPLREVCVCVCTLHQRSQYLLFYCYVCAHSAQLHRA